MAIQEFEFKPGKFSAVQFDGENIDEIIEFVGPERYVNTVAGEIRLRLGGDIHGVQVGWWVRQRDGIFTVHSKGMRELDWLVA